MSALIEPQELQHETDIVWPEDIERLDCVRQSLDRLPRRSGKPAYHRPGRLVGDAVLVPDARASRASGTFLRRIIWLAPHDRDQEPGGVYATGTPSEAVEPRTIRPGEKGAETEGPEGREKQRCRTVITRTPRTSARSGIATLIEPEPNSRPAHRPAA